ncbi:MAG: hypothetical protein CME70_07315 [Halobacteriovorax sp.]|nr:hypothetical protein [Halobacteriovorax sp.]|tara:strand:+ start:379765 stop:380697 length:933 start_codon:yes stop_codon:yes gene_type:complete
MTKSILVYIAACFTLIISLFLLKLTDKTYLLALFLFIPVFLSVHKNENNFIKARNLFLLISLTLMNTNMILSILFLELAILFEVGKSGIKKQSFSLVPIFLLSMILISVGAKGFDSLLNFKNETIVFFLVGFRVLSELISSHTKKLHSPTIYAISVIFSFWWPWSDLILFVSFLAIVLLNFFFLKFKLKNYSKSFMDLILSLFIFGILGNHFEIIVIYFLNQIMIRAFKSDNFMAKEELLLLFSTIIYLVSVLIPSISLLEKGGLIAFFVISWVKNIEVETDKSKTFSGIISTSWARFGLCILGVVSASI